MSKKIYVADIETDGLYSTKIHVMSVGYLDQNDNWAITSFNDPKKIKNLLGNKNNVVVGHFFKGFDVVELERVLDFEVKAEIWDTLPLAWYVYPTRKKSFGLEAFGKDFGIKKPEIEDWENLTYKEYEFRCEQDVRINIRLWEEIKDFLIDLYGDWDLAYKLIKYLMFKADCLVDQGKLKCRIDMEKAHDNIKKLEPLLLEKETALKKVMPPGKVLRKKPKVMYKKDKSISALGQSWFKELREKGLPLDSEAIYDEPNPSSISQLKAWLFSLNWKPLIFEEGANGPVPQIRDENRELCESILTLAKDEPAITALEGLTVINHRLNILKAFVETADYEGYTIASAGGFTNTLRLKHRKPIANLPRVTNKGDLRDGRLIRECIIANDGHILCGSDISSLEDQTKRHYMWSYDQEYVIEQMEAGYDPHLDLALRAGALTEKQVEDHKLYSKTEGKQGEDHTDTRHVYKTGNYSCIYGIGIAGLAKATGLSLKEARELRNGYWERNWSIKQLVKDVVTKVIGNQIWLFNPVSQYWYSARNDRDIFSTLNQGTGSFIFDLWVKLMIDKGLTPFLQYHDEVLLCVLPDKKEETTRILKQAMDAVNLILDLNVNIKVDVQFGSTYADVH